jgi:sialic acid synthase SpsE
VVGTKAVFAALGTGRKIGSKVQEGVEVFRRSVYVVRDITAGEAFTGLA